MTEIDVLKLGKLRSVNSEELILMLSWRNAPSVRMNMYTQHEIGLDEHLAWWERIQGRTDQKYFMYDFQDTPLGIVAFNGIDQNSKNSEWAFYASPDALKGTGSRMEYLALDYAFNTMKLHKLTCEVLEYNSSVIRLHEKFGFKVEGIFREHYHLNDKFFDIYRMGILSSEWSERRNQMLGKLLKFI